MHKRTLTILVLLVAQFILGMLMNLFSAPPGDPKFATEPVLIKLIFPSHIIVALLLLAGAIFVLAFSLRNKIVEQIKIAGQGLSSIIFAIGGGLATVFLNGAAANFASLIMAISFLSAFIAYGRLYYSSRE
jgi:hypothetical protein